MRLENFSDAVMAIAITLIAVEFNVPHFDEMIGLSFLQKAQILTAQMVTFLLGFMTIAIFWVNHHQLTQHITVIKRRVTWATMAFLFFITLIPFASRVLFENIQNVSGVMFYSAVLFGGSMFFSVLHALIHKKSELTLVAHLRSAVGPLLYIIAIAVAPFSLSAAYIALVASPLFYFLPRKHPNKAPALF